MLDLALVLRGVNCHQQLITVCHREEGINTMKSIMTRILKCTMATMVASALVVLTTNVDRAQADTLTIGAAPSLKAAFQDFLPMFEKEYGVTVRVVYGSSQTLRRQIEKGDSIDVFLPEAAQELDILQKKGMMRNGGSQVYAQSSPVLVMSSTPKATMTAFHPELSNRPIRIAIADPKTSALGKITARMMAKLKTEYRNRLDFVQVQSPDEILNLVQSGSADMGIVYRVDAINNGGRVVIIDETPAGVHTAVQFGHGVVRTSREESQRVAEEFIDFIKSPRIQKLLLHYGFDSMPS